MAGDEVPRARQTEAFWRAHHEGWKRSALNQREYCELHRLPLKAFGNWRAKFKAEPEAPTPKLLYRRGGTSHTLSHRPSHTLSHGTYLSVTPQQDIFVPPARTGRRRRFDERERRRIVAETAEPGASVSEVARRYGIPRRVLCRWRQEQAATPHFVDIEIVDGPGSADEVTP